MEKLVPVMAGLYLAGSLAVVVTHGQRLPEVFSSIFREAFSPRAAIGGGMGAAIRWGVSRGIFSNEAGLGSAPIAHAAADATPRQQGLMGIFEVFLDTVVLCTLTAVTILASGVPVPYGQDAGVSLAVHAMETVFGPWSSGLVALCLTMLALATLISWNLYGVRCAGYLWGRPGIFIYQLVYILLILVGAAMELSVVWMLSDLCNGLMALPNLAALLMLVLTGKAQNSIIKKKRKRSVL
jgi:AGCS family alanine or glycine:cation symporter